MKLISAILLVSVLAYVRGNVVKYEEVELYNEDDVDDEGNFLDDFENLMRYDEYELSGKTCTNNQCCWEYSATVPIVRKKFGIKSCVTLEAPNIIVEFKGFGKSIKETFSLGGNKKAYDVKLNWGNRIKAERAQIYNINLSKKSFCVRIIIMAKFSRIRKSFKPSKCFHL